jgi:hypothetical protein
MTAACATETQPKIAAASNAAARPRSTPGV